MKKAIIGDLLFPRLKRLKWKNPSVPYDSPIILLHDDNYGWHKVLFFDGKARWVPQWMLQSYWEFR